MLRKAFQNMLRSNKMHRVRIEGPLDKNLEFQITQTINKIQQQSSDGLLVIINSFGGSLQAAKNISARLKKLSLNNQIPLYCFAEQFCLNSANLILTTGTKSFAHKFSIIGDFGFVYESIDSSQFQKTYGVNQRNISTMKTQYNNNIFNTRAIPTSHEFIQKLLNQSEESLRKQVLINRNHSLSKIQQQSFIKFLQSNEGFLNLQKSKECGLIDGVIGIQEWMIQNCKGKKIIEGAGQQFENSTVEWIRSLKESLMFKQQ